VKKSEAESFNQDRIASAMEGLAAASRTKRALECGGLKPLSTIADLTMLPQRDEIPSDFPVRDLKPGNAWRRAPIGPCHAAGIEKQNATAHFVARDVGVPV